MKPRAASWIAWPVLAVGVAAAGMAIYFDTLNAAVGRGIVDSGVIANLVEQVLLFSAFTMFGVVGAFVASRRPANSLGWLMLSLSTTANVGVFGSNYAVYSLTVRAQPLPGAILGAWVSFWLWFATVGFVFLVVLLFPTGKPLSRRWAIFPWLGGLAVGSVSVLLALSEYLEGDGYRVRNPIGIPGLNNVEKGTITDVAGILLLVALLGGIAQLVVRFRRSRGEDRFQLKWFTYAAAMMVVGIILDETMAALGAELPVVLDTILFAAPLAFLPIAIGIAILKYRLYGIDLVINKTLVYAALAAFITLIYVGVVVGIGTLVGQGDEPNLALSLAATGMVAVAFQPVRERVQRVANRLVFGDRLSPYEAVTSFSHKVSATMDPDTLLKEMAEAAARGVGAERSRVTLILPDGSSEEVTWGDHSANGAFDRTLAVTHQAEVVGEISVTKKKGEALTKQDDSLLEDLASQAGLAMRNLRLTEELRHRLVELQRSRKRIVKAQDTERRRMERDIHDGAQQQLVSMSVKLSLAKNLLAKDPAKAESLLEELKAETQEAVESLRDLARGLFPPILVDQGLISALNSHITKSNLPATIEDATAGARFDLEVEANIFFVIREALQNASKHAPGASITIRLQAEGDHFSFEVRDQGPGFDPEAVKASSGTQNMRDRIEALGGSFEFASRPGAGTEIAARVPVARIAVEAHSL